MSTQDIQPGMNLMSAMLRVDVPESATSEDVERSKLVKAIFVATPDSVNVEDDGGRSIDLRVELFARVSLLSEETRRAVREELGLKARGS